MANKKITELNLLQNSDFSGNDSLAIVDDSAIETKKTTITELDLRWASKIHTHAISDVVNLSSSLSAKEPTITAGTTGQYYRGDKTFQTLDKNAVGLSNVDNTSDANKPVSSAQATAIGVVQSDINSHELLTNNPHSVTKTQVGLSNVDNTSDANKPVSSATQTALDLKQDILQNNLKQSFTIPTGFTAIMGRIEIALNQKITIELGGRLVLI